jgi:hypothetical protein
MECKICFEKYNEKDRKPKLITSCGHTFCEFCLRKLIKCPTCVRQIAGTMTNYDTLDFSNSTSLKTKSEENNQVSPERLNLKKEIEENEKKLSLKADEQLKKTYEIIKLIKANINKEVERKKQLLANNHQKLVGELDRLETKLNNDILSNQNDIESEIENIIAKLNEDLNLTEMNKIKKEAILLKKIKSKIENLEKLEVNYSFKPTSTDIDVQIGQIMLNNNSQVNNIPKSLFSNLTPLNAATASATPFSFQPLVLSRPVNAQTDRNNHLNFNFTSNKPLFFGSSSSSIPNDASTPIQAFSTNSQNLKTSNQSAFTFNRMPVTSAATFSTLNSNVNQPQPSNTASPAFNFSDSVTRKSFFTVING